MEGIEMKSALHQGFPVCVFIPGIVWRMIKHWLTHIFSNIQVFQFLCFMILQNLYSHEIEFLYSYYSNKDKHWKWMNENDTKEMYFTAKSWESMNHSPSLRNIFNSWFSIVNWYKVYYPLLLWLFLSRDPW